MGVGGTLGSRAVNGSVCGRCLRHWCVCRVCRVSGIVACARQDVDTNHSGAIEPLEFLNWCTKSRHLMILVVRCCWVQSPTRVVLPVYRSCFDQLANRVDCHTDTHAP